MARLLKRCSRIVKERYGLPGGRLPWGDSVRIQSGNTQCYGEDGRFGSGVTPLYEDSGGNLWAGAMSGLWRWKPGPPKLYPMPDPAQRIYALIESDDGGVLIARHSGITKLKEREVRGVSASCWVAVPTSQAASGSQWWPVDRRPRGQWAVAYPRGKNGSVYPGRRPVRPVRYLSL